LESVMMCLAVNAKEAMECGGTLTLRTGRTTVAEDGEVKDPEGSLLERLQPGDYAVLAVEDNGKGMDRETLGRIFEPYFTTKPGLPGKVRSGNGLGLSIAYGVLKQSGGAIHVESEPGKGTRIRLYLPLDKGLAGAAVARGYAGETPSESRA
jgi:signal transduction histidine kinase